MMIEERIKAIEATLNSSQRIPQETKEDLIRLLAELKAEVAALPAVNRTNADSITRYAHTSASEAVREEKDPQAMEAAIDGLHDSVKEFETSHPRLTETVNRLAAILSNMGI